ncbi:Superfamily II DNA and RNA helicase [Catalinimonas alkaloidigena]|uniref:Superfamily II DNA and RNA helicase n=1 Tax=Catalinimonas alkaloidigena TaxID=1075417 RepID=A0A1G9EF96_9BACT|nr:DEAD/DEAH box helicase [Catalinimonas alkaloidigena]SDK74837.1 Superfamily II DNA and RNA helicase [Catalinimonas alkaloidigena]
MTFHDFNLHSSLTESIDMMQYNEPTPVQAQAIPEILSGRDLIGCAQTGTGKTAAYLIPTIQHILDHPKEASQCLILAPTRELAKQIDQQIDGFGYLTGVTSMAIYGGSTGGEVWSRQRNAMENGAEILVATPGRLIAHMRMGYVQLDHIRTLILDEADKMLDMGFFEDIIQIVNELPTDRQTLLFSATMPKKIRLLADRILRDPAEVNIAISRPAEKIDQSAYLVHDHQKIDLMEHILRQMDVQSMIVFTSRRSEVNKIVRAINKLGFQSKGVSSDLDQNAREEVMREFKNGQLPIVVATDVLSRGIDVDNISHVVNYDIPQDAEDYIHRIGRTARAERTGVAITFINGEKQHRVRRIEELMEMELPKLPLPEGFEPGPAYNPEKRSSGAAPNQRRKKKRKPKGPQSEASASAATPAPTATPTAGAAEGEVKKKKKRKKRRKPRPQSNPSSNEQSPS